MTIEYYPTDGSGMIGSASYDDDFVMDFTDNSLFNSLCMPGSGDYVEFPNPREIGTSWTHSFPYIDTHKNIVCTITLTTT